MKKIVLSIFIVVLCMYSTFALVDQASATVGFEVVEPSVIYDMPFNARVSLNTGGVTFLDYRLSVTSNPRIITMGSYSGGGALPKYLSGQSADGKTYRLGAKQGG